MKVLQFISKFHQEESGQDTVEYVLIGGAVILALVAGGPKLAATLGNAINTLNVKIQNALVNG